MSDWSSHLSSLFTPSLEKVLTSPDYFSLTTATDTQRALCRYVEHGARARTSDLSLDTQAFRRVPEQPPLETFFCAGIRSGKSLFQAACIVHAALSVKLSHLRPGEVPRTSIVSVDKRSAQVTLDHVVGSCQASPILAPMLIKGGNDNWYIKRPDGRLVEIAVIANRRDGASLVSCWSAGVVFDEAARIQSGDDAVISLDDARSAVLGRILPGARIVYTSSPTAPYGLFFDRVSKPFQEDLVVQARGDLLNPAYWTPQRAEKLRIHDPDVYNTDFLAQFSSPEASLFPLPSVLAATRPYDSLPPEPGLSYTAAIDPATRGNAFTLIVASRKGDTRFVAVAREWRGTRESPLKMREVLAEVASMVRLYGITHVVSDQYMVTTLNELAQDHGISIYNPPFSAKARSADYLAVSQKLAAGQIEIPDIQNLKTDLLRTQKVPMQGGGITIRLPVTTDGRHADYVPSFVAALSQYCRDEDLEESGLSEAAKLGEALKKARFDQVKNELRDKKNVRRKWA